MKLPTRIKSAISYNKSCGLYGENISETIQAYYTGRMGTWHNVGPKTIEEFKAWIEYNGLENDASTADELNPLGL